MSVILDVGPKCKLVSSRVAPLCLTVLISMQTGQTGRRTDGRQTVFVSVPCAR